jgi:hypothetical protein
LKAVINIGAVPGQIGRVAKIFREGATDVGQNAARQTYARSAADDVLRKSGASFDEYNAAYPDMVNQFAGTPAANTYQGLESAAYRAGTMGGNVADKVGGAVNSMGGAAGLGMNALFMAPMLAPMVMGGGQQEPSPEQIQQMQMQQMRQQRGY